MEFQTVSYGNRDNCIRLSDGKIELIITTDFGPRIIRFGFVGGQNMLKECNEKNVDRMQDSYGHRFHFWHPLGAKTRTSWKDYVAAGYCWDAEKNVLRFSQSKDDMYDVGKVLKITFDAVNSRATITQYLINRNPWDIEIAPMSRTALAPNSRAIVFQKSDYPRMTARFPGSDFKDWRWTWGNKYIQLKQSPSEASPQRIGLWARDVCSYLNGELFLQMGQSHEYQNFSREIVKWPKNGINLELFTDTDSIELERYGQIERMRHHVMIDITETWELHKVEMGEDEESIDAAMKSILGY